VTHAREKREHVRVPLSQTVYCEPTGADRFPGVMTDLGLCGARVAASRAPPVGTPLVIVARLPNSPEPSRLPATVRWALADRFGVQFGLLGARDTRLIAELMAKAVRTRA
jgi:type IV pilus assembly protein PilZ